jgi:pimeloyl-ACP methyl ester carboxylesterase
MTDDCSVLLVPGSWHGAWAYDEVALRLSAAGAPVHRIDLPSNDGSSTLAADAAAVRGALDEIAGPTVIVAHSYGGIAVSEGAAGSPHAAGLVYLCAFMLDVGESLLDALQHQLPEWISLDETAGSHIPRNAAAALYGDCPTDVAERAAARLSRQSVAAIAAPQTAAAWRTVRSTYVVCERDAAVPPAVQEAMAARANAIERIDASHSPFLSRPGEVAAVIERAVAAVGV